MTRQKIVPAVVVILVLVGVWASSIERPSATRTTTEASATLPPAAVSISSEVPLPTTTSGPILITATFEVATATQFVVVPPGASTDAPLPTLAPTAFTPVLPPTVPPAAIVPPTVPPAVVVPPTSAPTSIPNPQPLISDPSISAAEQNVIDQVNYQRSLTNLPPLARDESLMLIAESRAADMVARGYFGHDDPVTGLPAARTQAMQAGFKRAGENIYESGAPLSDFPAQAIGWFMTDAPHRDNILHPVYTSIGAGVAANGPQWILSLVFGA
ncbi:MAG: CAP domain-containing protein [Chloroflexi bacterium]|nr:CAP domain-containing protein [Chloroflexota bacterium]